jgi:hypothetical protein
MWAFASKKWFLPTIQQPIELLAFPESASEAITLQSVDVQAIPVAGVGGLIGCHEFRLHPCLARWSVRDEVAVLISAPGTRGREQTLAERATKCTGQPRK